MAGCVLLQSGVCGTHIPGTVGDICCAWCHTPTHPFMVEDQGTLTTAAHPSEPPVPQADVLQGERVSIILIHSGFAWPGTL